MSQSRGGGGGGWIVVILLVVAHFYVRSNLPGKWSIPIKVAGHPEARAVIQLEPGGVGRMYPSGNLLVDLAVATNSDASLPVTWWQYGPVINVSIPAGKYGKREGFTGLCLPFSRNMYVINFGGVSEFSRADAR
ncbi:MAG TPA: hypothetical protein VK986_12110 [Tepidisphaeraceae bacterium]|nr:hypothetical protein [Tepidisphaeraceae bacterium]